MVNRGTNNIKRFHKLQIICICQKTKWYTTQIWRNSKHLQLTHVKYSWGLIYKHVRMGFLVSRLLSKEIGCSLHIDFVDKSCTVGIFVALLLAFISIEKLSFAQFLTFQTEINYLLG